MRIAQEKLAEELRCGMEIQANIVQRYEVQLAALLSGIVAGSGVLLFQGAGKASFALFAFAFIGSYLTLRISLGRAFHYGLYEDYRSKWLYHLNQVDLDAAIRKRQYTHQRREVSSSQLPHYITWPAAAFLVPIVAMCIGATP